MSDKAAFVSGALLCVQRYRGNLDLYHSNSVLPLAENEFALPAGELGYAATNSVNLWDLLNKFNCITCQCNSCYNVRIKEQ